MDYPTEGPHLAAGLLKFGAHIPDTGGFSGAGLSIDKNVGRGLIPKRGGEDGCHFIDLGFPVGKDLRTIGMPKHFPVFEYPVIGEIFFK
jgi:hypothetical protein